MEPQPCQASGKQRESVQLCMTSPGRAAGCTWWLRCELLLLLSVSQGGRVGLILSLLPHKRNTPFSRSVKPLQSSSNWPRQKLSELLEIALPRVTQVSALLETVNPALPWPGFVIY